MLSPLGNTIASMEILKSWLKAEHGRGGKLARYLGVPPSFVTKMSEGEKPVPVGHGAAIEHFTGGAVTRQAMFPDDWQRIWPELVHTADTSAHAETAQGVV
jgi:DNA-binding transcriptional regulator YdaS (Cro superfamily)